jgi:hypothetical protein
MTKKHFQAFAARIADDIRVSARFGADEQKRTIDAATYAAHLFADIARANNDRFDRDRFLTACGL